MKTYPLFPLCSVIVATLFLVVASPLSAQTTLYWKTTNGAGTGWTQSPTSTDRWITGDSTPSAFAEGDSAVFTNNAIVGLLANAIITTSGINTGANTVTIRTDTTTTNRSISLTGAGSGNFIWLGQTTAGWTRFNLQSSTAWNGTITDESTSTLVAIGGNGSTIRVENAGAVGTSTKIALNGTGGFILHSGTGNQTVTIGELSGTSANALVGSLFEVGSRHLRVEQSTNTTYAGRIDPTDRVFTFEKAGAGSLRLTGQMLAATGNGSLLLAASQGELYFNGTSADLGNVTVKNEAIFGGNGTLALKSGSSLTVENGGILAPGDFDALGTLTINGTSGAGLVFSGDATIRFNLGGDKIALNGGTLGGSAAFDSIITFDFSGSSPLDPDTAIDLIQFGGTPGIDLTHFVAASPEIWNGSFTYNGNTLQYVSIPEPSSLALLIGGVLAGVAIRRRRNS